MAKEIGAREKFLESQNAYLMTSLRLTEGYAKELEGQLSSITGVGMTAEKPAQPVKKQGTAPRGTRSTSITNVSKPTEVKPEPKAETPKQGQKGQQYDRRTKEGRAAYEAHERRMANLAKAREARKANAAARRAAKAGAAA